MRVSRAALVVALWLGLVAVASGRRSIHTYTVDLDLAPEHRYDELITGRTAGVNNTGVGPRYNDTVWKFYNEYFAHDAALRDALYFITETRGKESPELQGEIEGLARLSNLPVEFVHGIQMLYELQTLMLPWENISLVEQRLPKRLRALSRLPWRGPGCTGIIATTADGTVAHARNLDFSPVSIMTDIVYIGIFKKGGKEVFRSQLVTGYAGIITGMRIGPDGYSIERNTRYPDHDEGNEEMLHNLLGGRPLNGWSLRKILESTPDYDAATKAIADAPFVSTEYSIISGVKKGTIFAKDPDSVAHVQTLGQHNAGQRDDYIIITNFDFFFHDFREDFDPTGGCVPINPFDPSCQNRRVTAQQRLNATAEGQLTEEDLFEVINGKHTLADTIFQAIINVEKSLWNVSQPDL